MADKQLTGGVDQEVQSRAVGVQEGVAVGDTIEQLRRDWLWHAVEEVCANMGCDVGPNVASNVAQQDSDSHLKG